MASTASQSAFNRFLNHPAGPKTIHFWAPAGKWFLVIAGLADLKRPADQLSPTQAGALTATGLIWARYSTQIIPVNYSLMAVNLFVGATGMFQLYRIWDSGLEDVAAGVVREGGRAQCSPDKMRIRFEVRDMTANQWSRYVDAVNSLLRRNATRPEYAHLSLFEEASAIHYKDIGIKHRDPRFLAWHNLFLRIREDALREHDPTVTVPYWSWDLDMDQPERSPIWSKDRFGGSVAGGGCIPDGPFRTWSHIGNGTKAHCTQRAFDPNKADSRLTSTAELALIVKQKQFSNFSILLELGPHGVVHDWIGGDMGMMYSPNDAIFFSHHAFIDKIWRDYQHHHENVSYEGVAYESREQFKRTATLQDPLLPFTKPDGSSYTVADTYSREALCEFYIPPGALKTGAGHPALATAPPPLAAGSGAPERKIRHVSDSWARMMNFTQEEVNRVRNQLAKVEQEARSPPVGSHRVKSVSYPHAEIPDYVLEAARALQAAA
ncbi:hypothetical protein RI367_003995 [Sorochytrium milnesiophthora]